MASAGRMTGTSECSSPITAVCTTHVSRTPTAPNRPRSTMDLRAVGSTGASQASERWAPNPSHGRHLLGTIGRMPSLNVSFTDEELEGVRAAAAAEGKSLKQYLHDLGVREMQRSQFVAGARHWADRLRGEFDDAFPDDVPPTERPGGAAAA